MDKKDRNSWGLAIGGAAVAGVSMLASQSMTGLEVTNDVLEAIKVVLGFIPVASAAASAIGLVQLLIKYGSKGYELVKQKLKEKYHISEKDADKMIQKAISNDSKSSSKESAQKGVTDIMKKGFTRGAPINNPQRRSARNPVNRNPSNVVTPAEKMTR